MAFRIGIDIGGTTAKLGLVSEEGAIVRRASLKTGRAITADALLEGLATEVAVLQAEHQAESIGVAAPGFRRGDGEGVENLSNVPCLDGLPLRSLLEEATGLPTRLDNDANAAALGEFRHGAGQGSKRVLVVTLGTGIGAGMVVDGCIHRICAQGLGDPGHVIVRREGPECACGGHGCMEAVASVPAIVSRANELAMVARFSSLSEIAGAAEEGQGVAVTALREAASDLGLGLSTLVHLLGPDRILLGGGGFDAAGSFLLPEVKEALFAHVQPFFARRLSIGRAALGNDAGIVGAASLAEGFGLS